MKHHNLSHLMIACVACLGALISTNCSSDSTPRGGSKSGDAGAGGESTILICGQLGTVSECDPVTAVPCDLAAGETCDHSTALGGFKCFSGPNPQGAGERCDTQGLFCGPSTACNTTTNVCVHYCCTDAQCAKGHCVAEPQLSDGKAAPGACEDEFAGFAGAGGDSGTAGGGS
jgi:hypothetical protein